MTDEVSVLSLIGDAESLMAALDETEAGINSVVESMTELADSAENLSALDDALAQVAEVVAEASAAVAELDTSLTEVSAAAQDAAAALEEVGTAAGGATEVSAAATDAAASLDEEANSAQDAAAALSEKASAEQDAAAATQEHTAATKESTDAVSANSDGWGKAASGMAVVGIATGMAAKSFLDMGMQAQDSLQTLYDLTGASQSDISAYSSGLSTIAGQIGVTMDQAAQGMYYVASAGYNAANGGMNVLTVAMKAAKGGGADMMTVADALTSSMRAYGASSKEASTYSDLLIGAVSQGKQTFQDLASAVGPLAVTGKEAGFSFKEVATGEALMTQQGFSAHRAVQDLDVVMRAIGVNAATVATNAQKMGLNFDLVKFQGMNLHDRLQYLLSITKDNSSAFVDFADKAGSAHPNLSALSEEAKKLGVSFNAATFASDSTAARQEYLQGILSSSNTQFEKLVGGANGLAAASILGANKGKDYTDMLKNMGNEAGATDKAFAGSEQTLSAHIDHIKASLSIAATGLVTAITPYIAPVLDKLGQAFAFVADMITHHMQQALPVLIAVGTFIAGTLIVAIVALIGPLIAAAAPFLGIVAAIALLAGGIVLLIQHWHDITAAIQNNAAFKAVWSILQEIGGALKASFLPVWQELQLAWQRMMPLFKQLWNAIQPLIPVFEAIGALIGGVVVIAIGVLIGLITGLIKGFAYMLSGIIQIIGGIVRVFTGMVQVVTGVFALLKDIFTGNWSAIGNDLKRIGKGILNIFSGLWEAVTGVFRAGWGMISGLVGGFVQGIISFFQHLFDTLVGHSIVPDMVNGILTFIKNLVTEAPARIWDMVKGIIIHIGLLELRVLAIVEDWIHGVLNKIGDLKTQAWNFIKDMVELIVMTIYVRFMYIQVVIETWVHFIINKIMWLKDEAINHVQALISNIETFFTSLPAKAITWMADFGQALLNGIQKIPGLIAGGLGDIANKFKSILGFSLPEEGPLSDADTWMPDFGELLTQGLNAQADKIKGASLNVATAISATTPSVTSVANYSNATYSAPTNTPVIGVLQQILAELQKGNQQGLRSSGGPAPLNANYAAINQTTNNSYNGLAQSGVLTLYQQMNTMAGYAQQNALRGAVAGLG